MFVFPAPTPVTTPVVAFTVAIAVFAEDQVPFAVGLAKVTVEPAQTSVAPVEFATATAC